jgi:hypothetical protein
MRYNYPYIIRSDMQIPAQHVLLP